MARVALHPRQDGNGGGVSRVIPLTALVEANDREGGVFVMDGSVSPPVVHRVTIQIGRSSGGFVEVLGGLAPDGRWWVTAPPSWRTARVCAWWRGERLGVRRQTVAVHPRGVRPKRITKPNYGIHYLRFKMA